MMKEPECRGLDILAFIVKPVQRLCKYPLLLRELIKYTPKEHSDYANLLHAMDKMESLVALVNKSSREAANVQKLTEIENSLIGASVCPFNFYSYISFFI